MVAPDPDEKMSRYQLARAADVAAAAFRQGGWRWTGGQHDRGDPYEPSAVDIALALVGMMRDVAESTEEFSAIHSGRFRVERVIDRVDERVTTSILLELGESAEPLPEGVTPLPYHPDQDETPNQGRGEDLDRTEGDDAPGSAADAGTPGGPHEGVDGPVGQDHGGAAGEPEPASEGAGASDPPHAALDFIVGAEHDRRADGTTRIGVEDHRNFPVGEWTRLYVPTARLDECCSALDAVLSGAHAPEPPADDLDAVVWVRSTGRGTHDVMAAGDPVPVVLATVMFREGVKGRTLALERFAAALGSVAQHEVRP